MTLTRRLPGLALIAVAAATILALGATQALASHVQCGDVITQDTTLDSDLIDCPGTALVIGADNITLDLGGFDVRAGPSFVSGTAIADEGHRDVRIVNGGVGAERGISLFRARNTELRDLDLSGNPALQSEHSTGTRLESSYVLGGIPAVWWIDSDDGAIVDSTVLGYEEAVLMEDGSDHNRIEGSGFSSDRAGGVTIADGSHNRIAENSFDNAWFGLTLRSATDNEVVANTVFGENDAIGLFRSDRNRIERNSIVGARFCKLCLTDSNVNLIRRNSLASRYPSDRAMDISGSGNRIERNDASGNASGIRIMSGVRNSLLRNTANDTQGGFFGADGIVVMEQANGALLKGNIANRNGDDGIDVRDPSSRLIHNAANLNGDLGIEAVPGVVGMANSAFGNGNPLQCLNVFCKTKGVAKKKVPARPAE